jgi:pentapeptide MXKDX repeat protein
MTKFVVALVCSCVLVGTAIAEDAMVKDAMSSDAMKKGDGAATHAMKKGREDKDAMHRASMKKDVKKDSMRAADKSGPGENAMRKDSMKRESGSDSMAKDAMSK